MKAIALYTLLGIGLGCQSDISPAAIESFKYGYLIGFTGQVYSIRITPLQTAVQLGYNQPKVCTSTTSPEQWQDLLAVTNLKEFKNYKSDTEPKCCDRGGAWIKIIAAGRTYSAENEFLPNDSTSIGKVGNRLSLQLGKGLKTCR